MLRAVDPTRAARTPAARGAPVRDLGALENEPDADATAPATEPPEAAVPGAAGEPLVASAQDDAGVPIHRGWAPLGSHHRWMEPFVLMLLANGAVHGYAVVSELAQLGITNGSVDVGQVYRTLRDLERAGQVRSLWMTGSGPARRDYELTSTGARALDEWAAVMKERKRLIGEFDAGYLAWAAAQLGLGERS